MVGISQGSQPLVSYHYGKEDHTGCQKLLRYALTTVCIFAPALFLLVFFFAPQIGRPQCLQTPPFFSALFVNPFRLQYDFTVFTGSTNASAIFAYPCPSARI